MKKLIYDNLKKHLLNTRRALLLTTMLTSLYIISKDCDLQKSTNSQQKETVDNNNLKDINDKIKLIFPEEFFSEEEIDLDSKDFNHLLELFSINNYLKRKEDEQNSLVAGLSFEISHYLKECESLDFNENSDLLLNIDEFLEKRYKLVNEKNRIIIAKIFNNVGRNFKSSKSLTLEKKNCLISKSPNLEDRIVKLDENDIDVLSKEFQQFIDEKSLEYGIPSNLVRLIIDQESGGTWETNGVVSPTNDYGLCQINKRNFKELYDVYGFSEDEIRDNPYKNLECALYIIQIIFDYYGYDMNLSTEEMLNVCGTYNGWVKWRDKEISIEYVSECRERIKKYN